MENELISADAARREKIFLMLQEDPALTNEQIAKLLGVQIHVVLRDLQTISEDLRLSLQETHEIQKYRILREIRENKTECLNRLHGSNKPSQGARWVEEWGKLVEREMKILGIGQNTTLTLERGKSFDKRSRDAAVAAAIKAHEAGACVLDDCREEPIDEENPRRMLDQAVAEHEPVN